MRDNERQSAIILSVIGIAPVVWLALLIAPSVKGGLPEILPSLMNVFNNPFHIEVCEDSVKTVLILLLCYGMGIGIYFSTQRNYRRREEHGSAKWGNARAVDKKYRQSPYSDNKLMTQNVRIGLNAKKHRRNLNTLVCCPVPVVRIGVNDEFGHSGPAVELLKEFGLCAENIAAVAKKAVTEKK